MSKKQNDHPREGRRQFLKGALALGAAGAAGATLAGQHVETATELKSEPEKQATGYRESEHVRSYYRVARS